MTVLKTKEQKAQKKVKRKKSLDLRIIKTV